MRDHVLLYINGRREVVTGERLFQSLSDFLRYDRQLVGTKVVCAEGDCGSCCVLIGTPADGTMRYRVVTSCIQYVFQLDGCHVVTVEGLKYDGKLSCVQESMVACQGSQCGFCTPGFVVAMHGLLETRDRLTEPDLRLGLSGNLCRCTGYEAILKAGMQADVSTLKRLNDLYPPQAMLPDLLAARGESVYAKVDDREFCKPTTVAEAATFKADHPGCTLMAGGTDVGVVMNKGKLAPQAILSLGGLDLTSISVADGVLTVGALATLADMETACRQHLPAMAGLLRRHGSPPIRNAGTLAGNIANGSPIGDTMPGLFVLNAEVELAGRQGSRRVNINGFYTGYRTTVMKSDELITAVHIPLPRRDEGRGCVNETYRIYKVSKRCDLDISTFSAAFWMRPSGDVIEQIRIAYGGVAAVITRLPRTEQLLTGQPITDDLIDRAAETAAGEITPISDVRGGKDYRTLLGANIIRRFFAECRGEYQSKDEGGRMKDENGNGSSFILPSSSLRSNGEVH